MDQDNGQCGAAHFPSSAIRELGTDAVTLIAEKRAARETALARRGEAHRAADAATLERLWERLQTVIGGSAPGAAVSGYWAMRDELDIGTVLARLDGAGFICALPVVSGRGLPLLFRRWQAGDSLVDGPFGTQEPDENAAAVDPDIMLVPLLAFDRAGRRLGYGGGYYDRTLRERRSQGAVLAVGVAFAAQEMGEVPAGPGDERLDWIVTEREAIRVERE